MQGRIVIVAIVTGDCVDAVAIIAISYIFKGNRLACNVYVLTILDITRQSAMMGTASALIIFIIYSVF